MKLGIAPSFLWLFQTTDKRRTYEFEYLYILSKPLPPSHIREIFIRKSGKIWNIVGNITCRNLDSLACEFPVRSPLTNNTSLRNFQSEIRRLERGTHHSSPSNVKVKNAWRYIAIPMYAFIVWCFVWHRQNIIFYWSIFTHLLHVYRSISRCYLEIKEDLAIFRLTEYGHDIGLCFRKII
jgi:hypothetical protein